MPSSRPFSHTCARSKGRRNGGEGKGRRRDSRQSVHGAVGVERRRVVQRGVARCGAVRCGAVQCSAVRCGAVRRGAVQCGAVRCGAVRCACRHLRVSLHAVEVNPHRLALGGGGRSEVLAVPADPVRQEAVGLIRGTCAEVALAAAGGGDGLDRVGQGWTGWTGSSSGSP